jgi:hypothetical protein
MSTFPEAKEAAEKFAGMTFANEKEAVEWLELIISEAIVKRTANLAREAEKARKP